MARKRSSTRQTDPVPRRTRTVKMRRSPNAAVVSQGARGVRRLAATPIGVPSPAFLKPSSYGYRSVRTLIKRKASDGLTQTEAKQALLTNTSVVAGGVRVDGGGRRPAVTVLSKAKVVAPLRNQRRVKTPRPAPGGVRNPFGRRSI